MPPDLSKKHYQPLDGLRGIAILLVICVHSFHYEGAWIIGRVLATGARAGWVGVTLFFVLSGFLITGILLDTCKKPNYLRDFYARRSLRIFPLYFGFLALYYFVVPQFPSLNETLPQPEPGIQVYFWTYTANMREWFSGFHGRDVPIDPFWSLAVEEQVYLVWPFLILVIPHRRLVPVFVALTVISFAWRIATRWTAQSIEMTYCFTPANVEAFVGGALVAFWSRESIDRLKRWSPSVTMVGLLIVAAIAITVRHFNFWQSPAYILTFGTTGLVLLFSGLIGMSVTTSEKTWLNRIYSMAWLRVLGKYSYAIYVCHGCVMQVLKPLFFNSTTQVILGESLAVGIGFVVLVTLGSLGFALLSWYAWEQPFLRLKKYFPLSGQVVRPTNLVPPNPPVAEAQPRPAP